MVENFYKNTTCNNQRRYVVQLPFNKLKSEWSEPKIAKKDFERNPELFT